MSLSDSTKMSSQRGLGNLRPEFYAPPLTRDPMHDLLVYGHTNVPGISLVPEERAFAAELRDPVLFWILVDGRVLIK